MARKPKILRLPKSLEAGPKNIEELSDAAENTIEKHFFRRLANLATVKRFVIGWSVLMCLILLIAVLQIGFLRSKYQKLYFIPGGTLTEGVVGLYSNANPIYASGTTDSSVSKLIFSGLYAYDSNQKLSPDLAEKISIDKTEKVYTVTLKPNLYWHDGQPLTARDVVFTFKTIQNPDAQSPLLPNWQGIKVQYKDDRTVVFTLPSSISSFIGSLTTGILPEHILKNVPPDQLRSSDFNTVRPVGSGPFKYDTVQVQTDKNGEKHEQIGLFANERYYKGAPGIKRYIISTFNGQNELLKAYDDKKVDAISMLGQPQEEYSKDEQNNIYSVPLAGETMVFFKNSDGVLSDSKVRGALVLGSNRQEVIASSGQTLEKSDEPLLISQVGYNKKYAQNTDNPRAADKILDKLGWKMNSQGFRTRKGQNLQFTLSVLNRDEYVRVANVLKNEWKQIGVDVNISPQDDQNFKNTKAGHSYEALLETISVPDPDVFPFWHSSQADVRSKSRKNFSEYKSAKADASLEAGRSRLNPKIRAAKYRNFLQAWSQDNPALALYQPNYTFIVRSPFYGFNSKSIASQVDRYSNVQNWLIRQQRR